MRTHLQSMINFANNPEALAFVKIGTARGQSYYILVDYPLWQDDKEYVVRTDFTLAEAQADRIDTLEKFEAIQKQEKELAELTEAHQEVLDMFEEARQEILSQ